MKESYAFIGCIYSFVNLFLCGFYSINNSITNIVTEGNIITESILRETDDH